MPDAVATLRNICKTYPGVKALDNVSLAVRPGEVLCLLGENGAGKSTLMRCLTGAEMPDSGEIVIDGTAYTALSATDGHALGIGMIYQESSLVPAMSVAENIFLGHEPSSGGMVNRRDLEARAVELMQRFDLRFPPDLPVRKLGPAQQQLVQILKALSRDLRILVMDEPTAALTQREIEHLFELVRTFRKDGIAIIYISHRLEEILEIGDRAVILRDGAFAAERKISETTEAQLIADMVGRNLDGKVSKKSHTGDKVVLSVEGLSSKGLFSDVSFDLREGEVLGLSGLVGAGRSDLLSCLFGATRRSAGTVRMDGAEIHPKSPREAIAHGMGLVPEERRADGLVLDRSVAENMAYPQLDRFVGPSGLRWSKLKAMSSQISERMRLRTPSQDQRVGLLSGGNQQKIVIGKWIAAGARVLLLDEPTRGIDVNAKREIYGLIEELTATGVSVILVSSELPEVLGLSDRIAVMSAGQMVAILDRDEATQINIMEHAFSRVSAGNGGIAA
ncbi:monosaccharide ABC transporter ATP-binding protein (CUT2 family) [Aliiruegeria haliotis]|uniref:Monosaccharide ABC transporter ATP-binding protein (CUT2 family) n=1 Tax=Aliiruegeria haliotis TaxID=1280846 RepID=A0A2T0REQ6_9RHOB|nr:sugar ABC transporter ATP-binding protein [Aliiruegeria haliotis]PRY19674.1 monosaccharide ABC transporter ATP-binding protein (CUT2 family) [Aliiruegeria haliotis]